MSVAGIFGSSNSNSNSSSALTPKARKSLSKRAQSASRAAMGDALRRGRQVFACDVAHDAADNSGTPRMRLFANSPVLDTTLQTNLKSDVDFDQLSPAKPEAAVTQRKAVTFCESAAKLRQTEMSPIPFGQLSPVTPSRPAAAVTSRLKRTMCESPAMNTRSRYASIAATSDYVRSNAMSTSRQRPSTPGKPPNDTSFAQQVRSRPNERRQDVNYEHHHHDDTSSFIELDSCFLDKTDDDISAVSMTSRDITAQRMAAAPRAVSSQRPVTPRDVSTKRRRNVSSPPCGRFAVTDENNDICDAGDDDAVNGCAVRSRARVKTAAVVSSTVGKIASHHQQLHTPLAPTEPHDVKHTRIVSVGSSKLRDTGRSRQRSVAAAAEPTSATARATTEHSHVIKVRRQAAAVDDGCGGTVLDSSRSHRGRSYKKRLSATRFPRQQSTLSVAPPAAAAALEFSKVSPLSLTYREAESCVQVKF